MLFMCVVLRGLGGGWGGVGKTLYGGFVSESRLGKGDEKGTPGYMYIVSVSDRYK